MNKKTTIVLVIFLLFLSILLVGGMVYAIINNFDFSGANISSNYSTKLLEKKEISNIKDLDIDVNSADVIIEENETGSIRIELYSNDAKTYSIKEENDKISVVLKESKNSFKIFKKGPVVRVYAPSNYSKKFIITSNVGDVKIKKFYDALLEVKSDVGDVKVSSIKKAIVTSRVGDIKIENVEELKSSLQTGDVKIGTVSAINSKTKTGDIKINEVKKLLKLESKTGDIKIETATIKEDSSISSNVGDVKIKNVTGCYINGKTNVGDLKINNLDRKSDIELTITSRVGDIKVNY